MSPRREPLPPPRPRPMARADSITQFPTPRHPAVKQASKKFFFEKKNQKTFVLSTLYRLHYLARAPPVSRHASACRHPRLAAPPTYPKPDSPFDPAKNPRHPLPMPNPSRIGFLLTCFLLPGLIGTFASFSIPAPVIDEQHQQAALDAIQNAPSPSAQTALIQNLPNEIDPAPPAHNTTGTAPLPQRLAAARIRIQQDVLAEARDEAYKIRLMVITFTVLGALFGVALLGKNP